MNRTIRLAVLAMVSLMLAGCVGVYNGMLIGVYELLADAREQVAAVRGHSVAWRICNWPSAASCPHNGVD